MATAHRSLEMDADAMDEFQEADILWPDTDGELVPFAAADVVMEEPRDAAAGSAAPVLGRRFEGSLSFLPGGAGPSASSLDADDEEEEWQEADVLWPETADIVPRGGGGGLPSPFSGGSGLAGRRVNPAAARRDRRRRPAASSPIDIPTSAAARRRFGAAMNRRP